MVIRDVNWVSILFLILLVIITSVIFSHIFLLTSTGHSNWTSKPGPRVVEGLLQMESGSTSCFFDSRDVTCADGRKYMDQRTTGSFRSVCCQPKNLLRLWRCRSGLGQVRCQWSTIFDSDPPRRHASHSHCGGGFRSADSCDRHSNSAGGRQDRCWSRRRWCLPALLSWWRGALCACAVWSASWRIFAVYVISSG